jgi:hypothetical protein
MYNKIFTNSLFHINKENFANSNNKLSFPEFEIVNSGVSNDSFSLTEKECKAYAESNKDLSGYNYDTLNITNRPYGCYRSGNSFRYAQNGTSNCGSGGDNCIKKKQYMNLLGNINSIGINTATTPLHDKWDKAFKSTYSSPQVPECSNLQNCKDLYKTNFNENNLRKYYLSNSRLNWKFFNDDYKQCITDKNTVQSNLDICNTNSTGSSKQCNSDLQECNTKKLETTNNLSTCTTEKNNCNTDLTSCNEQKSTIVTQKDDVSSQLNTRNTELSTCNTEKDTCLAEKTELTTNFTTISTQKNTCTENLEENSTKLTQCVSQKTSLTDDLSACSKLKVQYKNNLDTCTNNKKTLQDELSLCNENLTAASGSDTSVAELLTTCNTNLAAAKSQKDSYLQLLNEKTDSLNQCTTSINSEKNKVNEIEGNLTSCNDSLSTSNTIQMEYFNKSNTCNDEKRVLSEQLASLNNTDSEKEISAIQNKLDNEINIRNKLELEVTTLTDDNIEKKSQYKKIKKELNNFERNNSQKIKTLNSVIGCLGCIVFCLLIGLLFK